MNTPVYDSDNSPHRQCLEYALVYILATREDQYRHTAENIRNMVAEVLAEYEVNQSGIVYVTDNAANMKAAFLENCAKSKKRKDIDIHCSVRTKFV